VGVCGRECSASDASSCVPGDTCIESIDGYGCFSSCSQEMPCEEGLSCVPLGQSGASQCLKAFGDNCLQFPCEEGRGCSTEYAMGVVAFTCRQCCNPLDPNACGPRGVCGKGQNGQCPSMCYQACGAPGQSCPEGQTCSTITEDLNVFGCRPKIRP
jgi:hypothetical protein